MNELSRGTENRAIRVAVVTNIPAPYRVPVYNLLADDGRLSFKAFYGSEREPDRRWDLQQIAHPHVFLDSRVVRVGERFIHIGSTIRDELKQFDPDVVITTGYNPIHLAAVFHCVAHGRHHIAMTDGTVVSESRLGLAHRSLRSFVIGRSSAGIAASNGSWRLLRSYGLPAESIHFSPLCANLSVNWSCPAFRDRDIDLLFSGRFVSAKNPGFVLEMGLKLATNLQRRVSIVLLGSGPLENEIQDRAATLSESLDVLLPGHQPQGSLPEWFARARLFVFPTRWDPWGVVANEACHSGTPTLCSAFAGAANELICDGRTGRVLPLDSAVWADEAAKLISDEHSWQALSRAARASVDGYSFKNAAEGIADAALQATAACARPPPRRRSTFVRRPRVVCIGQRFKADVALMLGKLRATLDGLGIEFVVVNDRSAQTEPGTRHGTDIQWAEHRNAWHLLNSRFVVHHPGPAAKGADLVIVTDGAHPQINVWPLFSRHGTRLARWGPLEIFPRPAFKRAARIIEQRITTRVDWWFTDTESSAAQIQETGYPRAKVTVLNGDADTSAMIAACASATEEELSSFRKKNSLDAGPIGLFASSAYDGEQAEFMCRAALRIRAAVPTFQLLLLHTSGDPQQWESAFQHHEWIHHLGRLGLAEKAVALTAADIVMQPMPDEGEDNNCLAAGRPIVTTEPHPTRSQNSRVTDGRNGRVTPPSVEAFSKACEELLTDERLRAVLGRNSRLDCIDHAAGTIVDQLSKGIQAALGEPSAT
jgi:glycosyltransferase involved in cell wall biosynthesis